MWLFCGFLRVVRFQAFHCRDLMLWCRMAVPLGDGDRRMSHEFPDRKSTRLNSSHREISYAVFCLKKKKIKHIQLAWSINVLFLTYRQAGHKPAYIMHTFRNRPYARLSSISRVATPTVQSIQTSLR